MKNPLTLKILGVWILAGCVPGYASAFLGTSIPIPAGLVQGDTFQLVFVTYSDGASSTISNIAYYNDFVNSDALTAPGSVVVGLGITWSCLCSTTGTNVLSNIVNSSSPIYDLEGNLIANGTGTSGSGLYSGTLLDNIQITDTQSSVPGYFVWTGTDANGASDAAGALGTFVVGPPSYYYTEVGNTSSATAGWTQYGSGQESPSQTNPLYAISNLLELGPGGELTTASSQVAPEPATIGMTLLALALVLLGVRSKRRHGSASPGIVGVWPGVPPL